MKDFGLKGIDVFDVYSASYFLQHQNEFIKRQEENDRFIYERLKKEEAYRRAHRWDFLINLPKNIRKGLISLFKKQPPKIVYRYGKARPMDKVTLKNMQRYPIWVDEYVETDTYEDNWMKPLLDTCNVTEDMESIYILMKEEESNIDVSATLNIKKMQLSDLYSWNPTTRDWETINPVKEEEARQWKLKSVPLIKGKEKVLFTFDKEANLFNVENRE